MPRALRRQGHPRVRQGPHALHRLLPGDRRSRSSARSPSRCPRRRVADGHPGERARAARPDASTDHRSPCPATPPPPRRLLLREAERLFARRGLYQVTVREIIEAAGQRNVSALNYHFGSREGVLDAILDRHGEPTDVARGELLDAVGRDAVVARARRRARRAVRRAPRRRRRDATTCASSRSCRPRFSTWRDAATRAPVRSCVEILGILEDAPADVARRGAARAGRRADHAHDRRRWPSGPGPSSRGRPLELDEPTFVANLTDVLVGVLEAPTRVHAERRSSSAGRRLGVPPPPPRAGCRRRSSGVGEHRAVDGPRRASSDRPRRAPPRTRRSPPPRRRSAGGRDPGGTGEVRSAGSPSVAPAAFDSTICRIAVPRPDLDPARVLEHGMAGRDRRDDLGRGVGSPSWQVTRSNVPRSARSTEVSSAGPRPPAPAGAVATRSPTESTRRHTAEREPTPRVRAGPSPEYDRFASSLGGARTTGPVRCARHVDRAPGGFDGSGRTRSSSSSTSTPPSTGRPTRPRPTSCASSARSCGARKHDGFWVVTGHERAERDLEAHRPAVERPRPRAASATGTRASRSPNAASTRGGFIEMDPPEQSEYRRILNPFLSPAAVKVWDPLIADFTRACIDDVIETRPPRLRRRLRQRRAGRPHHGDARPAARRLGDLLRARAHAGVHGARQPQLGPHDRADHAHGRAAGRVRADPQDRAPARDDHRAAQRQGDGRVPPRRRHHRHRHAAHRRRASTPPRRCSPAALDWLDDAVRRAVAPRRRLALPRHRHRGVPAPLHARRRAAAARSRRTARSPGSSSPRATACSCRTRCATTTRRRSRTPTRSSSTGSRTRTPRSASACTGASGRTSPASTSSTCCARRCDACPTTASTTRARSSTSRSARSTASSTSRRRSRPAAARVRRWPR